MREGQAHRVHIGPDPEASGPPLTFGLDTLTKPRLVTWAIHPTDLDAVVSRALAQGYDPGEVSPLSRRTPDGTLLSWRLTAAAGLVPFLIDWGATAHPAGSGLPQVRLVSLTATHPDPTAVQGELAAVGATLTVTPGARIGLHAELDTPHGSLTLS